LGLNIFYEDSGFLLTRFLLNKNSLLDRAQVHKRISIKWFITELSLSTLGRQGINPHWLKAEAAYKTAEESALAGLCTEAADFSPRRVSSRPPGLMPSERISIKCFIG